MSSQDKIIDLIAEGLIEYHDSDEKDILNYSKLIESQNKLKSKILSLIDTAKSYNNLSEVEKSLFDELESNFNAFFKIWVSFCVLFKKAPTQDELIAQNNILTTKKIINDFNQIHSHFKDLQIEEKSKIFNTNFSNFINNQEARLETTAQEFDEFLKNFVIRQENYLNKFENQVKGLNQNYVKNINSMMKKARMIFNILLGLNFILAFILGGVIFKLLT